MTSELPINQVNGSVDCFKRRINKQCANCDKNMLVVLLRSHFVVVCKDKRMVIQFLQGKTCILPSWIRAQNFYWLEHLCFNKGGKFFEDAKNISMCIKEINKYITNEVINYDNKIFVPMSRKNRVGPQTVWTQLNQAWNPMSTKRRKLTFVFRHTTTTINNMMRRK